MVGGIIIVDEALLLRYYSGEVTADEKVSIEQWLSKSEENRKMAKDIWRQEGRDGQIIKNP